MCHRRIRVISVMVALLSACAARAGGRIVEVSYPPSETRGELSVGVTYTLWLPEVATIRGIIVHQHGCGTGACKGGATAAYDLHWQALAKKWDCALLGPSYQQEDKQDCRLWCDPRKGSHQTFLRALRDLAVKSKHPEVQQVPWCLWGHSGGAFWASLMQTLYPERIVAIWFRSGTAFAAWEKGDIARPNMPEAIYRIPMMCNPGAKEKDDKRFSGAWTGSLAMFQAYRARGAPIGFAPDPRTGHECGDCRYLAIPFFDVCLAMRLADKESPDRKLRAVDMEQAWLAEPLGDAVQPARSFTGKPNQAVWLPGERFARAWIEYVKTGSVSDTTPPPAPFAVAAVRQGDKIEITWDAEADFESGLQGFIIERDGKETARLPQKPIGRFGRPLFQAMSYHDTPEKPLPRMQFIDRAAPPGAKPEYQVTALNSAGLKSAPARTTLAATALVTPDLAGWVEEQHSFFKAKHARARTWAVKDGVLICDGSLGNCGFLRYRAKLTDFTLRLDYRMSKGCNSGVCIRAAVPYDGNPETTLPSQTGFEIQIMDDAGKSASKTSSGALYGLSAPKINAARPAGEWNTLEVSARRTRIRVIFNGQLVQDIDQTAIASRPRPLAGYLSLQNHGHGIEFRNLRLETGSSP
ncbi:MAG: DUF1080 domain-containing protein [Planctomycetes bacterium]|nr:DUF1080 domain-containing protein [Planctomycetota bacterium]